jgi:hypothetical protein
MIEILIAIVAYNVSSTLAIFVLGCMLAVKGRMYKIAVKSFGKLLNKVMPLSKPSRKRRRATA